MEVELLNSIGKPSDPSRLRTYDTDLTCFIVTISSLLLTRQFLFESVEPELLFSPFPPHLFRRVLYMEPNPEA